MIGSARLDIELKNGKLGGEEESWLMMGKEIETREAQGQVLNIQMKQTVRRTLAYPDGRSQESVQVLAKKGKIGINQTT